MPTVLVVEDQEESQYLLQSLLTGYGYTVLIAEHGELALELALQKPPDLVVSDIMMPMMDGFRLCRAWKEHPLLRDIPFVFYTATYTDLQDEQLAQSVGADAYIIKPAEPTEFIERIQAVLDRYRTGDLVAHVPEEPEDVYMRAYNAALVRKLEQKMVELEATNQQLQASEARLRAITSASPDLICVLDADGQLLELLTPVTPLLPSGGLTADSGLLTSLLAPAEAELLRAVVRQTLVSGETQEIAQALVLPEGERWFEGRTAPLSAAVMGVPAVVLVARDITGRKQAERQLQHAQKVKVLGQLTAGIAHDFNNLLTVINGYSGMLLDEAAPEIRPTLEQIVQAGERASALTRQLLAFSRNQVLEPEATDLNRLVLGVEKLLRRVIGEDIELNAELASDLWTVVVDPGQIEQVLLNLAVNARDAMPGGGRLTISTANLSFDTAEIIDGDASPCGEYVVLMVSDTGHGMSSEVQAQIFEPFFTTKAPGTGTGLGLSVVHGIITQSGGCLGVTSTPGVGTTMKVYLPRCTTSRQPGETLPAVRASDSGHEMVLLVEDDRAVRGFVRRVLERSGYWVIEAADGMGALEQAARHRDELQLLLTDVVLPDMAAKGLVRRLHQLCPSLPVLLMSGYAGEAIQWPPELYEQVAFLAKPLSASALVRKVRAVLDARPSAEAPSSGPAGD